MYQTVQRTRRTIVLLIKTYCLVTFSSSLLKLPKVLATAWGRQYEWRSREKSGEKALVFKTLPAREYYAGFELESSLIQRCLL